MAGPKDKAAKKQTRQTKRAARRQKRSQIWQAFKMQRREDKALIPWMIGVFLLVTAVIFGLGYLTGIHWFLLPVGMLMGGLAAMIVFGRRVQRTVYTKAEGQPGAGAWALDNMKGRWRVTHSVAATTQLDAVHRVLGNPGVILVAEGAPHRVKNLLAQEKKRVARLVGEVPIYNYTLGTGEGQVPLGKLQRTLMKLPRNLNRKEVDGLEAKLAALGTSRGAAMPKGPQPNNAKMRNIQRTIRRK